MARWRVPRRTLRLLRYIVIVVALCAACCFSRICQPRWEHNELTLSLVREARQPVDFAWGSILHRFQNYPGRARRRRQHPWQAEGKLREAGVSLASQVDPARRNKPIRVLIVTSEFAGLHKNGGIGTAFSELAHALAAAGGGRDFETSVLLAHLKGVFPVQKREQLREELASKGISLLFVEKEPQPFYPQAWTPVAAMRVWRYLRSRDGSFDIVHFPDNTGIGYFASLGKLEGLALRETKLVVGLHGADVEWAAMLNKRYPIDKYAVDLGVFEQRTAEWADTVVAPSEYILEYARQRGWKIPDEKALVIPNIVSVPAIAPTPTRNNRQMRPSAVSPHVEPIRELVFFGRLEERKGVRLLVSVLESLYTAEPLSPAVASIEKISFLGRDQTHLATRTSISTLIKGALDAILQYTNATFEYEFFTTYDRDEALAYLADPSRLALLPALADNSPSTVLECIAHDIRFLASDIGGIPELLHPEDRDRATFAPLAKPFTAKLHDTLDELQTKPWTLVRAAEETQSAAHDWVAFHHWLAEQPFAQPFVRPSIRLTHDPLITVCITHYERPHLVPQLLESLLGQSYTNFEVILVDDGSTSTDAVRGLDHLTARYFGNSSLLSSDRPPWHFFRIPNSYLGAARNRAAQHARGTFLLFLDDDDVLKPHALSTLVSVANRTGAAALSTWLDEFATDVNPLELGEDGRELPHRRTYWFLGQELGAGLMSNAYGSGNIFVHRRAWARLSSSAHGGGNETDPGAKGAFSTYREVGGEDWEFWTRLALEEAKEVAQGREGEMKHYVVPEELIFARSDPARASMKFSMDPWDAHFHATAPILNDPRIQDLNLAHSIMLLKGVVTREYVEPAFTDSRENFQVAQGWGGWFYSFETLPPLGSEEQLAWAPSLAVNTLAIAEGGTWLMDGSFAAKPYIDDTFQEGWLGTRGERVAAIRTFKAPKPLEVAVDANYRSHHTCGDGTRLSLIFVAGPGEAPQVLVEWSTMDEAFGEHVGAIAMRRGSTLSIVSDPLVSSECDRVEVHVKLTPVSLENQSWSALARRMSGSDEAKTEASRTEQAHAANATGWSVAEDKGPSDDEIFNIALIFDRNRFSHAKSVIRSIRHFTTSRRLVFHLIAPYKLHEELHAFFADTDMSLRVYDHSLCSFVARQVLPFSNPDIHISAHCKMFLSEIVTFADRILYLDTDVTVTSDLAACYDKPLANPGALVSMAVDMGDACQREPDVCWPIGLHWRLPEGLVCGNVPARAALDRFLPPLCPEAGELETLQVNGGVALFELAKMKESGFLQRYIQSIVHHYRIMKSTPAVWGEQDFINSYFRLFPEDLEVLPCGCNYQWFGTRREVKCGLQPVTIAHHWSHGIAARTDNPYNILFHHFLDSIEGAPLPPVPGLSPSLPGAPNSSAIVIEHTLNCPRQSHDCIRPYALSEHGRPVIVLSRVLSETFAADLVDALEAQTYPKISHVVAFRQEAVDLPPLSFKRELFEISADPVAAYAALCEACGNLAEPGQSCSAAPSDHFRRKAYFDCVCALPDPLVNSMHDLEAFAKQQDSSWLLYLDDTQSFASAYSLSQLMAEVDSPDELILFRINTTTAEQEPTYLAKALPRSPLSGVGMLFHSSHLDRTDWSGASRCGKWATFNRLQRRLRLKWIDLVPVVEHPLQRHLPMTLAADLKVSVVILETQGKVSWTPLLLETLQLVELAPLVSEILVASVDTDDGAYGPEVEVVNPSIGSGLSEFAALVASEHVLLLSDSVAIDKTALMALINFHLDSPSRIVGLFTEISADGDFSPPLPNTYETFDIFDEPDALVGQSSWTHLLPRTLLTSRSNLNELSTILGSQPDDYHFHPICHPVLLSALSVRATSGQAPLRVLPPEKSVVDRVHDCRIRSWAEVDYGKTAGDWALPKRGGNEGEGAALGDALVDEGLPDGADDVQQSEERLERRGEQEALLTDDLGISEEDFPLPPTLADCIDAVKSLLGSSGWTRTGSEVGLSGPQGLKVGIVPAAQVSKEKWEGARREERCYKT
ncbi:proteophosphoglycan ppg4 [Rhodotorula toruloides]|uniref:Proteophosphoglycan ppg4 n=1 Tax=Rhodotorula toruloides TaxID=5286 RepID=A0A511KBM4_RHOTO|nr:proteophosphoglycan ppg4 [Rhodotorula toruloides]